MTIPSLSTHIVDVLVPTRLDRYLRRLNLNLTQAIIEKLLRLGYVKLNGHKTQACIRVLNGDHLSLHESIDLNNEPQSGATKTFSLSTQLLAHKLLNEYMVYSDDNLLAINKPSGLATQGGSKIKISVCDALSYLNSLKSRPCPNSNISHDFKLVHRLDKDTSGLLLIAKNYAAAYQLSAAFKEQKITKTYLAIVTKRPPEIAGVIEGMLWKCRTGAYDKISDSNSDHGKIAITHYQTLASNDKISLLELIPYTGRMHQLRFHALKLGCPIVGDKKYCAVDSVKDSDHLLLHAKKIVIPRSLWAAEIVIEAELPQYFKNKIKEINANIE